MDMKRLNIWVRKILGRVDGPVLVQEIWGKRTDRELREVYEDLDVVAGNKKKRLEWF